MENLDGKCVVLGVTGGIATYKMANVASGLRKAGARVHVMMTENATQFITPLTFETLTNNRCVCLLYTSRNKCRIKKQSV